MSLVLLFFKVPCYDLHGTEVTAHGTGFTSSVSAVSDLLRLFTINGKLKLSIQSRFLRACAILLSIALARSLWPSLVRSAAWAAIFVTMVPSRISSFVGSARCSAGVVIQRKSVPHMPANVPPMAPVMWSYPAQCQ